MQTKSSLKEIKRLAKAAKVVQDQQGGWPFSSAYNNFTNYCSINRVLSLVEYIETLEKTIEDSNVKKGEEAP